MKKPKISSCGEHKHTKASNVNKGGLTLAKTKPSPKTGSRGTKMY